VIFGQLGEGVSGATIATHIRREKAAPLIPESCPLLAVVPATGDRLPRRRGVGQLHEPVVVGGSSA